MFKVIYANEVYDDIQNAVDFYNSRGKGLGTRFFKTVKIQLSKIKSNAYSFQVRYHDVRCIPINKFPYTIHYRVDTETNTIMIIALFCDFQNPGIWEERMNTDKTMEHSLPRVSGDDTDATDEHGFIIKKNGTQITPIEH